MNDYKEAEKQDKRRRRRERYLIISLFAVITFLTYLGIRAFDLGAELPFSSSILVFALININVILLLLLLFLTVRNLVKLVFERRKNIMGAKLRTKLVVAFVALTLLPTGSLFFVSVQFISTSIEYWFNLPIEKSLKNSLEVGQQYYDHAVEQNFSLGNNLSRIVTYEGYMKPEAEEDIKKYIHEKQKEYRLASIKVYTGDLTARAASENDRIDLSTFEGPGEDILRKSLKEGTEQQYIESSQHGDLVSGIVPVFSKAESKAVTGVIVVSRFVPGRFVNRLKGVAMGLQEYTQLKMLKNPMKISHLIMLSIATLLIIFLSVWFGFYLSRELTIPIKELAEGTNRIASGDYNFSIDLEAKDELGTLVNSFNRMTLDLKTSKNKYEEANRELKKSNIELEQRRLYMEIVLANVAAGVVSADAEGRILTINKSAEDMLNIDGKEIIGENYRELLPADYKAMIDNFLESDLLFRRGSMKKQIRLSLENRRLTLLASLNVLRDDKGNYLGLVAVFEDLSEIEKAQRMAAWRDVARRIAHEVKNPLTPIQLSTQRLKKRCSGKLDSKNLKVFDDCTGMIIKQVEELKRLVNEFSKFARMPSANPAPEDIREIISEAISLYTQAHKEIEFVFNDSNEVPVFDLDREQMKRVIINLLDNAIEATNGSGQIYIRLGYDKLLKMVRIEVADNGKGISPEHKSRLFEPYFSTKKQGTGLGLAIVNNIVTDHNGFIRVQDNKPRGTKFVIELPVRT